MSVAPRFILLVTGLLVVAALTLWPGRDERLAMLADDGRHKEVIAHIERQLANASGTPDLLAALARSYAAIGEYHRAIDVLDAYLAMRPNDLGALERQAELLLHSGPIGRHLDAMARLVAAQPSPNGVTRLIELYRLHGRVDDELTALRAYAERAMLDSSQLERLGAILAERAEWREARRWLEMADRSAAADASTGRLLLLDVLIQSNDVDQAYRRGQVWMTAWRSSFLSAKLILRLAQSGLSVPATELALEYAKVMPEHVFEVAGLLARNGCQELAHRMLVEWVDRTANPTRQQLRALVHASVLAGDVHAPVLRLAQLIRGGADPTVQAMLAEEVASSFGKAALMPIRAVAAVV
jgi:tetratricopeptide (TPR) repeat protein